MNPQGESRVFTPGLYYVKLPFPGAPAPKSFNSKWSFGRSGAMVMGYPPSTRGQLGSPIVTPGLVIRVEVQLLSTTANVHGEEICSVLSCS